MRTAFIRILIIGCTLVAGWSSELLASRDGMDVPAAEWAAAFGVDPARAEDTFAGDGTLRVQLVGAAEPTNILWPGEAARLEVRVENLTAAELARGGRVVLVNYETTTKDGEIFAYSARKLADAGSTPIAFTVPARGAVILAIAPPVPERKGAYAVLLELDGHPHRLFVTSLVRTFAASAGKRRFFKLTMDLDDPLVLRRLGAAPNRIGMAPRAPDDPDAEAYYQEQARRLRAFADAGLPICVEFGHGTAFGGAMQPLGRNRPHLDARGVMQGGVGDIAWSPAYDDHFAAFVERLLVEFGWPKGPINAVKIWNEPWNGGSIAGWGADDERFREMTLAMDRGVRAARAKAGVEVLQGGADSSSNSLDKYFSDGLGRFDPMFDFLSVHYQGTDPHTNLRQWRDRKRADGTPNRVLFWDTESWVGNTDDRVCAVLATMFSFGQDRAVGIDSGYTVVRAFERRFPGAGGGEERRLIRHAFGPAAAVGAFQHLVGERPFAGLLWRGLPFVLQFDGLPRADGSSDPEDATVVVVGDMGFYHPDGVAFRTVRSRHELEGKRALRAELARLAADAPERATLEAELDRPWPYAGCSMSIAADGDRFSLLDFYGNPIPPVAGRLVVPLSVRGSYLRGDGRPGSHAALLAAIRDARIDGYEPLETRCHDFTAPIASRPSLRLELRNVLNRPLRGALTIGVGGLAIDYPRELVLAAHEMRVVEVRVTGGAADPGNRYPLDLRFVADDGAIAEHHEDMRVNWISRRTITVDGRLDEWDGAIPQPLRIAEAASATTTAKAWRPDLAVDGGIKRGFALAWLAWDDERFAFAARIADATPHPGTLRFATRDDDAFFYPEVSYRKKDPAAGGGGEHFSARWDGFLRPRASGGHRLILRADDGVRAWVDGAPVIDAWVGQGATDCAGEVELVAGRPVPLRIEYFQGGGPGSIEFDWIEPGGKRLRVPSGCLSTTTGGEVPGLKAAFFDGTDLAGEPRLTRVDADLAVAGWPRRPWEPAPARAAEAELEAMTWPSGVRRYSYRSEPILPAGNWPDVDNVQIAFNVLPEERKTMITALPGLFPDYMNHRCTDYEWALDEVAPAYGGGTEVWRLRRPDMPHKHFYPRTLRSPADGPAPGARLAVVREGGWRIVEATIPWSEVPEAKARLDAGLTVKFSYRVNDDAGVGCMELSKRRSVAKRNGSFMVDWVEHWANELEFAAEPAR